jgi:hypothetical protein
MDALLQTLGAQSFKLAVNSGLIFTGKYALQQCSRLLESVSDRAISTELKTLQRLLDNKIKVNLYASMILRTWLTPPPTDPISRSRFDRVQVW